MNRFSRPLFLFIRFILPLVGMVQYALAQQPSDCNYVPGAGHFDLCVSIVPPNTSGARMVLDTTGFFKNEAGTGKVIVEAEFGDIGSSGGEFETDNPGWVVPAGDMEGGEFLWFRARGSLRFWDAAQQQWLDAPPNGERVRYIGSLRPDLAIVLIPTPEQAEAIAFYEAGTIWSADGLSGPLEAPIEPAASVAAVGANGDAIHAHLDFCVEDSDGDPESNETNLLALSDEDVQDEWHGQ